MSVPPDDIASQILSGGWFYFVEPSSGWPDPIRECCIYRDEQGIQLMIPYLQYASSYEKNQPPELLLVDDINGLRGVLQRLYEEGFVHKPMSARPVAAWAARVAAGERLRLGRPNSVELKVGLLGGFSFISHRQVGGNTARCYCAPFVEGTLRLQRHLALYSAPYEVSARWSPADPLGDVFFDATRQMFWQGQDEGGDFTYSLARYPDGRYQSIYTSSNNWDPMGGGYESKNEEWLTEAQALDQLRWRLQRGEVPSIKAR